MAWPKAIQCDRDNCSLTSAIPETPAPATTTCTSRSRPLQTPNATGKAPISIPIRCYRTDRKQRPDCSQIVQKNRVNIDSSLECLLLNTYRTHLCRGAQNELYPSSRSEERRVG